MKAELSGWPIVGGLVLAMLFCGVEQARATSITTVDFEDLGVAYGKRLDVVPSLLTSPPGSGVISRGFSYNPNPANGYDFNDLHISNQKSGDSFNGTTVAITHNEGILTEKDGGLFSLKSFDFAGFPLNKEVSFTVTGFRDGFQEITQLFNLIDPPSCLADCLVDGKVDGMGEYPDFQTFYLNSNWTNLRSVTWKHTGYGTTTGLFALDNIVVNKYTTVPEFSTITLLGLGLLCLLSQSWLARKRLKALGVRTHSRAHKMSKTSAH